jgi:hypothetical protein
MRDRQPDVAADAMRLCAAHSRAPESPSEPMLESLTEINEAPDVASSG